MPGRAYDTLFEIAVEQYGYITTADARDLGLGPEHLVDLARRGDADRIAHGLYRFRAIPTTMRDQLMEATLWPRRVGIISHASALDLWDLCDVNPAKVHITVPKTARIRREASPAYEVHQRNLPPGDVSRVEGIPVVSPRRAILDGIETHLGGHLIDQAVDMATRRGDITTEERAEIQRALRMPLKAR